MNKLLDLFLTFARIGGLTFGVVVHQLLLRSPAALFHDFLLEHREHGILLKNKEVQAK